MNRRHSWSHDNKLERLNCMVIIIDAIIIFLFVAGAVTLINGISRLLSGLPFFGG
jgi:hypothetical protein